MQKKRLARHIISEIPRIKRRNCNAKPLLHILNVNSTHIKWLIAHDLGRSKTVQFVEKLALAVHFRHEEITGRHIRGRDTVFVRQIDDAHQIIVLRLVERLHINVRSRCYHADHFALYNAFGQLRIFHLFADGNFVPLLYKAVDIRIRRMKRDATHRSALLKTAAFSGQCQFEFPRYRLGIVKKHLIEIAETIKQNTIFIFFLCLQIMLHHWCNFLHVKIPFLRLCRAETFHDRRSDLQPVDRGRHDSARVSGTLAAWVQTPYGTLTHFISQNAHR